MTQKMAINKVPCAPQNRDNATSPTLATKVLPVKENTDKEKEKSRVPEVVVLDDDNEEEEGEEGEEGDDEEAMFQWALSTLRRTQYLSDSDSEEEAKSQPSSSGAQVSQTSASNQRYSEASVCQEESNQREVLSGSEETSPAVPEQRSDSPLLHSPAASEEPPGDASITAPTNHLQNNSDAKPFNLPSAVRASILRENPTIKKIQVIDSGSSSSATKPSDTPLVIFNRLTPYIELEDCTVTESCGKKRKRKQILLHFYTCSFCEKVFTCTSSFERHKKLHEKVSLEEDFLDDSSEDEDDSSDSDYDSEDDVEGVQYSLRERAPKRHNIVIVDTDEEESPTSDSSNYSVNSYGGKRKKWNLRRFGLRYTREKTRKYNISDESSEDDTAPSRACDIAENIAECVQHFQCYLCQEELNSEVQLRGHLDQCSQSFIEHMDSPVEQCNEPELNSVSTPSPAPVLAQHKDKSLDLPCDRLSTDVIPSTRAGDPLEDAHTATAENLQETASNKDLSDSATRSSNKTDHTLLSGGSYPIITPRNCASTAEELILHEDGCSAVGALSSVTMHSSVPQDISMGNVNRSSHKSINDDGGRDKAICIRSCPSSGSCSSPSVIQDTLSQSPLNNSTLVTSNSSCNNRPVIGISAHEGNNELSTVSIVEQYNSSTTAPSDISVTQGPSHSDSSSASSGTVPLGISTPASTINLPVTKGSSICETMSKPTNNSVPNMRKPVSKRHHSDTISDTSGTLPITNSLALGDITSTASSSEEPLAKRHHAGVLESSNQLHISSPSISTSTNGNEYSDTPSVESRTLQLAMSKREGCMSKYTNGDTVSPMPGDLQPISNPRICFTSHDNLHGDAVSPISRTLQTAGLECKEPGTNNQYVGVQPSTPEPLQINTLLENIPFRIGLLNVVQMMMQSQTHETVSNSDQPVERAPQNIEHHGTSSSNTLVAEATSCSNKISTVTSTVAYAASNIQELVTKVVPHGDNSSTVPSIVQHGDSNCKSVLTKVVSHSVSITSRTSVCDQGYSNSMGSISKVASPDDLTFSISSKQVPVNNVTNPGLAVSSSGNFQSDNSTRVSCNSVPETNVPPSEDVISVEPRSLHHNVRESSHLFPLTKDTTPKTSQPLQNTDSRNGYYVPVSTSGNLQTYNSDKRLTANVSTTKASSSDGISTVPKKTDSDVSQLRQPVIVAATSLGDNTVCATSPTVPKGNSSARCSVSFPEEGTTTAAVTSVLPGQLNDSNPSSELTTAKLTSQDIRESTSEISHQNDSALEPSVNVHSAQTPYSGDEISKPGTLNCDVSNTEQSTSSAPSGAPGVRGRISVKPLSALVDSNSRAWKYHTKKRSQDGTTPGLSRTTTHRVSSIGPLTAKQTSSSHPPSVAAKNAKQLPWDSSLRRFIQSNSVPYSNSSLHGGGGHYLSGQVLYRPVHQAHYLSTPWRSNSTSVNVPNNIHGLNRSDTGVNSTQSRSIHSLSNGVFPVGGYAANTDMPGHLPVPVPYSTFSGRATNFSGGIPVSNTGEHAGETAPRTLRVSALSEAGSTNLVRPSPAGVTGALSRTSDAISSDKVSIFYPGTNLNPVTTPSNIPSVVSPSSYGAYSIEQQYSGYQSMEKNVQKV